MLNAAGIPAHTESRTGYFTTIEIQTLLNLLRIVDNPRQDIPLAAVMKSMIGGFTDVELAKIKSAYPDVKFHFYSGDATDVSERLNHGTLDFAVMLQPIDNVKYDFFSLKEISQWGILAKKDDPFSSGKVITKEDIRTMPLIMHQRIGLQNEIAHWAEMDVEDLNIAATYNVVHGSPISFVQQGLGYFLTTREMLAPELDPEVCFLPLEPQLPTRQALVWKKHAVFSKAAEIFKSIIIE